jgi:hypothetical protein
LPQKSVLTWKDNSNAFTKIKQKFYNNKTKFCNTIWASSRSMEIFFHMMHLFLVFKCIYFKWILHNINSLHFYFLNCKVTGDCNQDSRGKSAIDKVFIVTSILKLPFPCYLTPSTDMAVSLWKLDIMSKVDCANVSVSAIQ